MSKTRRIVLIVVGGVILACLCIFALVTITGDGNGDPTTIAPTIEAAADEPATGENTPDEPEATPPPTNTPSPTATPIVLTGSGDSIVDIDRPNEMAMVHISGNAEGSYFGVTSYDAAGNQIELLVNTTDPYEGTKPFDFDDGDHTTRFEVQASGNWTIEILPLSAIAHIEAPGQFSGSGDDLFAIVAGTPDTATISGNAGGSYFGVFAYGDRQQLLVNTTDPYEGTVILDSDTIIIAVQAVGDWTVEVSAK